MDKLEEAINAVQNAISRAEHAEAGGALLQKADLTNILSLLKAQQPRVMTLKEIPEYDGAFLIEYRHEVWPMQWTLFRRNLTESYRFICADNEIGFSIIKASYGRTWRCWTSRPTDAQRRAIPWKD